ncbi:MAG: hypothetical protein C0471_11355 [Erythrobacter sp.]|nr:hypothetical protein [Erythrobacter sp.]
MSGVIAAGLHMVDASCESAYARGSFDMFEPSSAGIALARADRTFCRLRPCTLADRPVNEHLSE